MKTEPATFERFSAWMSARPPIVAMSREEFRSLTGCTSARPGDYVPVRFANKWGETGMPTQAWTMRVDDITPKHVTLSWA